MNNKFRTYTFISVALLSFSILFAQAPSGYYDAANNQSSKNLKSALYNIIKEGKRLSYGSGAGATWSGFEKTDLHPDGYVWDMYSNNKVRFPGNGQPASGMNIEHSVAKSWWGGTKNDAYKDLHHLNPSNSQANSSKGSFPPGEIEGNGSWSNGVITVGKNSAGTEYSGSAFEVIDEYKGDFARAYLYMFTCYENYNWTGTSAPTFMRSGETYPMLKNWAQELLVKWSRLDPVSTKEVNRNEEIYKIQQNRNPYIDHPELVEYLWGDKIGQAFTTVEPTTPFLSLPTKGSTIQFGDVHFTASAQQTVIIKGKNLTGNLSASISGSDPARFTLSTGALTPNQVLEGASISITYLPESSTSHSATLTLSGGGLAAPLIIPLGGKGVDNFVALAATNITASGFTTHWTPVSGANNYELSVFKIEQKGTEQALLAEDHFTAQTPAWTYDGYTDFNTNDSFIRLASSNNNGAVTTAPLDLSKGGSIIITAKRYNTDASILSVYIDNELITTLNLTAENTEYEVEFDPATEASNIKLTAQSGKRAMVDRLQIFSEGVHSVETLLDGYPISLGNVLTHSVTGLDASSPEYLYSVRATGEGMNKSTQLEPVRLATSITPPSEKELIKVYSTNGYLLITGLEVGARITTQTLDGRQLNTKIANNNTLSIPVKAKGIIIVTVQTSAGVKSYKAMCTSNTKH